MCQMLLSINPEFVEKIFSKEKEFEFRKNRCKQNVNKIIIYCTAPVKKVVGEADIDYIIEDTPSNVWKKTQTKAGISKDYFDSYFTDCTKSVAYKLTNVKKYSIPKKLSDFGISVPPQSFVYLPGNISLIRKKFKQIDIRDTFFDSLKKDYDGFDNWFKSKSQEYAYVYYIGDSLKAFLYLKPESIDENYHDIEPMFLPKKRLKIGTFKVSVNGLRIGKLFLQIIFNTAIEMGVDEIYCTVPDLKNNNLSKQAFTKLLKDNGFYLWGTKGTKEHVYIYDIKKPYTSKS